MRASVLRVYPFHTNLDMGRGRRTFILFEKEKLRQSELQGGSPTRLESLDYRFNRKREAEAL